MTKDELEIVYNIVSRSMDKKNKKELKVYKKLKLMCDINKKQSEIDELVQELNKKDEVNNYGK